MPVLTPSGPLGTETAPRPQHRLPMPDHGPDRPGRLGEPWNRIFVFVAAIVGVGLLGYFVVGRTGPDDGTSKLVTPSPLSASDEAGDGVDSTDATPVATTAPLVTAEPVAARANTEPVRPGPPTTSGAAAADGAALSADASTPPTTSPPTTAAPTTAAPTTATPTTAAPTTAAPTTAAPTTAGGGGGGSATQQLILELVNTERAANGCGAVTLNSQLNNAATAHSEDMSSNDYFDHTGLNGSKPWDRAKAAGYGSSFIGENIAQGYGSADSVMDGWMNSPGHRANILNCGYNHLGVGLSNQGNYWTQLFGGG